MVAVAGEIPRGFWRVLFLISVGASAYIMIVGSSSSYEKNQDGGFGLSPFGIRFAIRRLAAGFRFRPNQAPTELSCYQDCGTR